MQGITRLIYELDKARKSKALNESDKASFIPVLDLLKGLSALGLHLAADHRQIVSMRVNQLIDTYNYVGESDKAMQLNIALLEL